MTSINISMLVKERKKETGVFYFQEAYNLGV